MRQVSPNLVQWLAHFNRMKEDMLNTGFKPSPINAREGLAGLTFGNVVRNVSTALDSRGLTYDPRRVCVAGDSGGGALCATVAHMAQRDAGLKIGR